MQPIASEDCMDVAQATQIALTAPGSTDIWEINPMCVSNEDVLNLPSPIDEHTYLATNFLTDSS